ncbi:hypothetical protein Tco_0300167 [Tanacetum coccineum]
MTSWTTVMQMHNLPAIQVKTVVTASQSPSNAQSTKTYYLESSRFKDKDFANSDLKRFQMQCKRMSKLVNIEAAENNLQYLHKKKLNNTNMTDENKLYFQAEKRKLYLDYTSKGMKFTQLLMHATHLRIEDNDQNNSEDKRILKNNLSTPFYVNQASVQALPTTTFELLQTPGTRQMIPPPRKTKRYLSYLKKANASLTQEPKECKTNLDESSRALGKATSSRDSSLIALQTKHTELEKYTKSVGERFELKNRSARPPLLILVTKGKSVETQFDKPSVVRQPNAQRIPKPSVLGKPTPFSNSPEMRSFQTNQSVNKTNASDGLFKPVTQQNLPQNRNQAVRNTNVLKPGMYRIASTTTQTRTPQLPHASRNTNPHMSKSSGVIHTTSVSRPQLKCYQVKDKVVPNISQVKFQKKEVEDQHRISSISKKTKSVTACNDSSNSRTSNVNAVCAECGKCVFNSNHDACVSRYLNDVNTRTKKPNVVPISASKPKGKANKSVATPHKKTVASDTTIQKSKSYYKELYENTNQEWKWWIAKRCPSDNATYSASAEGPLAVQFCFSLTSSLQVYHRGPVSLPEVLFQYQASGMIRRLKMLVYFKPESFGYQSPMLNGTLLVFKDSLTSL